MKCLWTICLFGGLLWASPIPIKQSIERSIERNARMDWPNASRIEVLQISSKKEIPPGATLQNVFPRPALGAVSFEAHWQNREGAHRTFGTAIVKVYQPVAVAATALKPQDGLDESKLRFEEREISKFSQNGVFTDWEHLENKIAKTFVKAGSVLHVTQVETPAEIRQGQMVDLIFENSQIVISARMKALEHGRLGSWIRVENPNSRRVVRARVIAPGRVGIR